MYKKLQTLLASLTLLLAVCGVTYAQSGTLSGTVTDAETGDPLPGANIYIEELESGTSTEADGSFEISGIDAGTYNVRVTFVGYQEHEEEVELSSGTNTLDIELQTEAAGLDEVVVNALGFEEDREQSGISSTSISGENVAEGGGDKLLSNLSARSSGLRITESGGDPGTGAYTLIRGQSTVTGDTQPLFVVDGVPVSNSSEGGGIDGVQQQSRINDLNPNDIENVEVLKGSSAAALWGSRAANGVIVITTRSGDSGDKLNVSAGSKFTGSELNKEVPLQQKFGQGLSGQFAQFDANGNPVTYSWGDKIADRDGGEDTYMDGEDDPYAFGPDGEEYYYIAEKNSRETYDHSDEVFRQGNIWENDVSLSGGSDQTSFFFSASNLNNQGIIQDNSTYDRTSIRSNISRSFEDFTFTTNINYVRTSSDRIQQGSNVSGLFLGGLRTPPDFNNEVTEVDFVDPETGVISEDRHRSYLNPIGQFESPTFDNPFWTIENVENNTKVNRFVGSFEASWDPVEWLNITNRTGMDTFRDRRYELLPVYSGALPSGDLTEEEISEFQLNNDLIARAALQISEDYSSSFLVGFNLNHREYDNVGANVQDFILPDAPRNVENSESGSRFPFQDESYQRTAALYGEASLDAYDMLFLDLTARGEAASTFGSETNNTFFYPSATLAWEFTQLSGLQDNSILSYGKLRTAYGSVGKQPSPYLTTTDYVSASYSTGWGPTLDASSYNGGYVQSSIQGNPELKPERKTEFELGADLRFFNDRLNTSITYYRNRTVDAIFNVDVAPSTGFTGQTANAAELENEGIELEADIDLIRSNTFRWNAYGNWSTNENVVTDLRGTTSIFLNGFAGASSRAVEGEALGVLWGGRFAQDENGNLDLDENGFPRQGDRGVIGDPNPDWTAGIGSTFDLRNISLDVLFDIKHGGEMHNGTRGGLYTYGTHEDMGVETTAEEDLATYNPQTSPYGETIEEGETFRGNVEDFGDGPVALDESWYTDLGGGFGPIEGLFVEDAGFVRLRHVRLAYDWTSEVLQQATGLQSIEFSATGRNLLLWTDYSGIDPETNLTGASNGQGLDYFQNPNTRSYAFSVRVNY